MPTPIQVASEKKLEHPCRPGQRKEDRPKHLSTIDHLRSITHFTGSAPKPHFSQKPASGDRNLLKTGRVTVMRATTNPVFRRSQGYTPVLFFALFWTVKPGSALRGMYYPTAWVLQFFFASHLPPSPPYILCGPGPGRAPPGLPPGGAPVCGFGGLPSTG